MSPAIAYCPSWLLFAAEDAVRVVAQDAWQRCGAHQIDPSLCSVVECRWLTYMLGISLNGFKNHFDEML